MPWLPPVLYRWQGSASVNYGQAGYIQALHTPIDRNSLTPSRDTHQPLLPRPIMPNPIAISDASGFKSHFPHNPFDMLFKSSDGGAMSGSGGKDISDFGSLILSQFVHEYFHKEPCLLIRTHLIYHLMWAIVMAFLRGPDHRLALDFVVQICAILK